MKVSCALPKIIGDLTKNLAILDISAVSYIFNSANTVYD